MMQQKINKYKNHHPSLPVAAPHYTDLTTGAVFFVVFRVEELKLLFAVTLCFLKYDACLSNEHIFAFCPCFSAIPV